MLHTDGMSWEFQESENLTIGTKVLIHDPESNIGPLKWKIGTIVAVYPGKDNKVRVCDVRVPILQETKNPKNPEIKFHVYKRPITRLSPLPLE